MVPDRELAFDPDRRGGGLAVRRRLLHRAEQVLAGGAGQDHGAVPGRAGRQVRAAKAAPFILVFVGEIIMAWALYGILVHMNAFTLRGGASRAALIWFGFLS